MKKPLFLPPWVGIFPFFFYAYALTQQIQTHRIYDAFWVCNLANLLLGVGLLFSKNSIVWISTLLLLVGTPLWTIDLFGSGVFYPHSFFTHVGSTLLGLLSLWKTSKNQKYWWKSLALICMVQGLSRIFLPLEHNVNLSSKIYPGLDFWFSQYWQYWFFNLVCFGLGFWGSEKIVSLLLLEK